MVQGPDDPAVVYNDSCDNCGWKSQRRHFTPYPAISILNWALSSDSSFTLQYLVSSEFDQCRKPN